MTLEDLLGMPGIVTVSLFALETVAVELQRPAVLGHGTHHVIGRAGGNVRFDLKLEGRYAACPKIILVCDNLNTHTKGAFYEVFEPNRAGVPCGASRKAGP